MKKVAINGFGRIGRAFFRMSFGKGNLDIVAINDPFISPEQARYLLMYDSVYHRYDKKVEIKDGNLVVDGVTIPLLQEKDPKDLPWGKLGIDVVIESTGKFLTREKASLHLSGGAKKVLLSAPAKDADIPQIVYGVNTDAYDKEKDLIISAASCTTNSLAPVAYVLEKEFGIAHALMSTVHGYTADQKIVDAPHSKFTRGRTAAANIVPTTTGAATATTKVIPSLKGKMDGMAFRVPVPTGSVTDFTAVLKVDVTKEDINQAMRDYATGKKGNLKGILDVANDPIVSSDIVGETHASVFDPSWTKVIDKRLVKVVTFYDNEWGYTNQLVRVATNF
ncbi:MAG: type I glyceraldehyde-3-phosphate dehydrogenase [Candidatus Bipolaricaulota bacterium]|nr:type I glyceraldehyde-3-phosphate dehydrogenase [Candidatus Bipolaricaulota bacterium]